MAWGIVVLLLTLSIPGNRGGIRKQEHFKKRGYIRKTPDSYEYEPYIALGPGGRTSDRIDLGLSQKKQKFPEPEMTTMSLDSAPEFAGPILNVTVNVGREAVLSCRVHNLKEYRVGWLKAGDQTILALHKRVITHNNRVLVSHEENKVWKLHIRHVEEEDRGCYMCQINTEQMKQELGCLDVNVPPDIDMEQTSSDVTVQENYNTSLVCHASGHPTPRIKWRREDGRPLFLDSNMTMTGGYVLPLARVGRKQMGSYLCIASNEVPPAVSKRITLSVSFTPEVYVPNQLIGVRLGDDVRIECRIEAYPNTINYWMKEGPFQNEMLLNNHKYRLREEKYGYKVTMSLELKNVVEDDLAVYTCYSTNSLGKADGSIRIYKNPEIFTESYKTTKSIYSEIVIDLMAEKKDKSKLENENSETKSIPGVHEEGGRTTGADKQGWSGKQTHQFGRGPYSSSGVEIKNSILFSLFLIFAKILLL